MAFVVGKKNSFSVKAYIGDNKTLLAFNFDNASDAKNLAGFTIECKPPGQPSYFLFNTLQFQNPAKHSQVAGQANSTVNAPIQKYRWTHFPGTNHQGLNPAVGNYVYTITPRFFDDNQSMKALDGSLSVPVTVPVGPFRKGALALGFTRGYMQSEAFAHHFGNDALLQPDGKPLLYDTQQKAGTNKAGQTFTFADEYAWMGATARVQVLSVLNAVLNDENLHLDVFAYDLNEPDVMKILLELGKTGRVRIILDNAQLHIKHVNPKTKKTVTTPEDAFTDQFKKQAKAPSDIVRGCFARFSHDKVFIVSKAGAATQVLTGSTNFSVTGLYVNANHVLVFDDPNVAGEYSKVFQQSWDILSKTKTPSKGAAKAFATTPFATQSFPFQSPTVPKMSITYSPHTDADVTKILGAITNRINQQSTVANGSVLFAVMQLSRTNSPVCTTLNQIFANGSVYSYGISDSPNGTHLYAPGSPAGVLVTGKPSDPILPPPFDQLPSPPGHEIHDKFVVCGLNGNDPTVYCGSSNLATGGEAENGDNLLEIHDPDVATVFAIEALALVDHYNFLDRFAKSKAKSTGKSGTKKKTATTKTKPASKTKTKSRKKH